MHYGTRGISKQIKSIFNGCFQNGGSKNQTPNIFVPQNNDHIIVLLSAKVPRTIMKTMIPF